jgi:hypothetical protein
MSYVVIYDSAVVSDSTLRKKIAVALHKAASDISIEDPSTADHSQRTAWARRVFADPVAWSAQTVWTILQNATIAADPEAATDSDVQFVVNSNIATFIRMT